jgi:hypothetical protein
MGATLESTHWNSIEVNEMLLVDCTNPILTPEDAQALAWATASSRFYTSRGLLRIDQIRRSTLRIKRPAMAEWCVAIIDRDENTTLPRGIGRKTSILSLIREKPLPSGGASVGLLTKSKRESHSSN